MRSWDILLKKVVLQRENSQSELKINVDSSTVYQIKSEIVTKVVEHHQGSRNILNFIAASAQKIRTSMALLIR